MRYLLDTNIVSELVRNPQGKIAGQILKVGETKVCTSIIVAAELRYGAEKKQSPRLSAQLQEVLGALEILPFENEPTLRTALFVRSLSALASLLVLTTCSSQPRRLRSGTQL